MVQYRPKKLDELILHRDIGENLSKLVSLYSMIYMQCSCAEFAAKDELRAAKTVVHGLTLQVASGDCPHTLFYGPPGAGKKTLILALLREVYGAGADKVRAKPCANSLLFMLPS